MKKNHIVKNMKRIVVAKQEEVLREEAQVLVGETITNIKKLIRKKQIFFQRFIKRSWA